MMNADEHTRKNPVFKEGNMWQTEFFRVFTYKLPSNIFAFATDEEFYYVMPETALSHIYKMDVDGNSSPVLTVPGCVRRMFFVQGNRLLFNTDSQIFEVTLGGPGCAINTLYVGTIYDFCASRTGKMAAVVKDDKDLGLVPTVARHDVQLFHVTVPDDPLHYHMTTSITDAGVVLRRFEHDLGRHFGYEVPPDSEWQVHELPKVIPVRSEWTLMVSPCGRYLVKFSSQDCRPIYYMHVGASSFVVLSHCGILCEGKHVPAFTQDGLMVSAQTSDGDYGFFYYPKF